MMAMAERLSWDVGAEILELDLEAKKNKDLPKSMYVELEPAHQRQNIFTRICFMKRFGAHDRKLALKPS